MSPTPVWVLLLVAALGVIGTTNGVVITQMRSDTREREVWERQRIRQREEWAREDQSRTFDQRREAYLEFYESLRSMTMLAYSHGMGMPPADSRKDRLAPGWQLPTFERLQRLEVYAEPDSYRAWSEAYAAAHRLGQGTRYGTSDESFDNYQDLAEEARLEFVKLMRRDLHIGEQHKGIAEVLRNEPPPPWLSSGKSQHRDDPRS